MEKQNNISSFTSYIFFWIGQLISIFGSSIVYFALTWWLTDLTESAIVLSIGSLSYLIPFILVSLIGGVVADKYDRKKVILIVDSLQAISTFVMWILFAINLMEFWMLFFFFAFRAVCQAFHMPTESAIIPTMVPKKHLSRINGINFVATGFIHIIGPVIGGPLLLFFEIKQILWIDVITFLISVIPLILVKIPTIHKEEAKNERESFGKQFKTGFKVLIAVPGLLALIIQAMICNFLMQPIGNLLPYYIRVLHMGSVVEWSLISMSFNIGMFIGGIVTSIKGKWVHKIPIITLAIVVHGIAYMLFTFLPIGAFFPMMIYSGIRGLTMPIINAIYFTILQTSVPHEKLGRITSIDNTLSFIAMPLGTTLSGILAEFYGIGLLFFVSASLYILTTIFIFLFTNLRKLDSIKEVSES
ncbi:MAG: MFS transporter [Candidatus Thorarchaeota archaeon]